MNNDFRKWWMKTGYKRWVETIEIDTLQALEMVFNAGRTSFINPNSFASANIKELNLSTAVENCLLAGGIKTIQELEENKPTLIKLPNLGPKGIHEILEALGKYSK